MKKFTLFSAILFSAIFSLHAENVKVGMNPFPPMVIEENGKYSGFDVEIWELVADKVGIDYEYTRIDTFANIFDKVKNGSLNLALGGISITKDREERIDFSHGYFDSGLSILIRSENQSYISTLRFYSHLFLSILKILIVYFAYTIVCAFIIWFLELENEMFRRKFSGGVFDGWYWVNVVVTTVGFGDKVPLSPKGRMFGVLLMWTGIFIMVPFINGKIASEMTARKLDSYITCKEDLRNRPVAVKKGTTAVAPVEELGAKKIEVLSIVEGLELLKKKKVDAVVTDMPVVKHLAQNNNDFEYVRGVFSKQDYGIVLQTNSPYREQINCALLELKRNGTYDKIYQKYFGKE